MDALIDKVTLDEFKLFYGLDRQLYTILVRDLARNPSEGLQIMGFWLWLERRGNSNLISKILTLDPYVINKACEEALTCLQLINNEPVISTRISLTQCLLKTELSLQYIRENRLKVFHDMQNLVSEVYIPALSDIMEQARHSSFTPSPAVGPIPVPTPSFKDFIVQAFSSLKIEGDANANPSSHTTVNPNANTTANPNADASKALLVNDIPRFARTMFVTFSKGYPVAESELREIFTRLFGNCIESLHMQDVEPDEQALYARIIFVHPFYIQCILNGESKAKFAINGKHVWMRQFVPRNGRLLACGCATVGPSTCPHHNQF